MPRPNAITTPITESRSRALLPRKPKTAAAMTAPMTPPRFTLNPISRAAAAPVTDSSLAPCTAKDICRATMSGPSRPPRRPSSTIASSACCMKS